MTTYRVALPTRPQFTILWANPKDVVAMTDCDSWATVEDAASAVQTATWMLDTATGHVFHGRECWVEEYDVTTCALRLWRYPVVKVNLVEQVQPCPPRMTMPLSFCHASTQVLDICGGCGSGCLAWSTTPCSCGYAPASHSSYAAAFVGQCCCRRVRVDYQIGSNIPPGMDGVVGILAAELLKAGAGRPCRLPDRITNVTRQGVSWTILDPQDYLQQGLTGLSSVDGYISTCRRAYPSARMRDPLQGIRVLEEKMVCGGDPFDIGFDPGYDIPESSFEVTP